MLQGCLTVTMVLGSYFVHGKQSRPLEGQIMLNIWMWFRELCRLMSCRHSVESLQLYFQVSEVITSFDDEW
jgi:hypothetical protein